MLKILFQETFNINVIYLNTYISSHKKRRLGKYLGKKTFYKRVFLKVLRIKNFKDC